MNIDRAVHHRQGPQDVLGRLAVSLGEQHDVRFAYLFGSHAKGRARTRSDIDIAVWLDEGRENRASMIDRGLRLEAILERALSNAVQVVVLNLAPVALQHNVLRHGIPVPGGDEPARRRFYVDHARRYYDLEPARALFERRRRQRIAEGTFGGGARDRTQSAGDD